MIDLFFRAFSKQRWDAFAENRGITVAGVVQPGYEVDEIGNVQLTFATYEPRTVPTFDSWWCVNLRIYGQRGDEDEDDTVFEGEDAGTNWRFIRSRLVRFVREQATVVNLPFRGDTVRAYQFGSGVNRIQLLDPRDITTPPRVWLGGMNL